MIEENRRHLRNHLPPSADTIYRILFAHAGWGGEHGLTLNSGELSLL